MNKYKRWEQLELPLKIIRKDGTVDYRKEVRDLINKVSQDLNMDRYK